MAEEDRTTRKFDYWAKNGMAERMQKGHGRSVVQMLSTIKRDRKFRFIDIGCGNGWVVRDVAVDTNCLACIGIDKSPNMIRSAELNSRHPNEHYYCASIEDWTYTGKKFDYAFAMESIYYAYDIKKALANVYELMAPGGVFLCGTDFYAENRATTRWAKDMGITMHLLSEPEWESLFTGAGFAAHVTHIRDPDDRLVWKQKFGTLFIRGLKLHNETVQT